MAQDKSSFGSVVEQSKAQGQEHFDKTGIYEFDALGRRISDLRRAAVTRERQIELELADVAAAARDEISKKFEATPSVEAEYLSLIHISEPTRPY